MPYKYIGRTTTFRGKPLWEILANLKNFGVGRIVVRSRMERYPEKSFMKILKVEAVPNPKVPSLDDVRKVIVHAERTFRGVKQPDNLPIFGATYKADYRLIPKHLEHEYLNCPTTKFSEKILPKYMELPPLLQEAVKLEAGPKLTPQMLKMQIVYNESILQKNMKIADDNEKPTVNISIKLGEPVAPRLYKGVKL